MLPYSHYRGILPVVRFPPSLHAVLMHYNGSFGSFRLPLSPVPVFRNRHRDKTSHHLRAYFRCYRRYSASPVWCRLLSPSDGCRHHNGKNTAITQQDCLGYLKNDDTEKLLLLDVPYIGSEPTCAVTSYKYQPFHQKVAEYLFLYYRQSIPPKSNNIFNRADAKHIMKMRLARHFMNKEYYFQ